MPKLGQRKRRELLIASLTASVTGGPKSPMETYYPSPSDSLNNALRKAYQVAPSGLPMPDPGESWALVELYRLQHGELPPQNGEAKPVQISEALKALARIVDGKDGADLPPRFSVAAVLRYAAKELAKQDGLEALSKKVAGLNPDAGEIGPGMLVQLVTEARRLTPLLPPPNVRIRLITDLPVEPRHGMTTGKEFGVLRAQGPGWLVLSPSGQKVVVLPRECEEIKAPDYGQNSPDGAPLDAGFKNPAPPV